MRNAAAVKKLDSKMTYAEDVRYYDVGDVQFHLFDPTGAYLPQPVSATFHGYAITAFYLTGQSLEDLERSTAHIQQGRYSLTAIAYWFLSIESFLSSLLKLHSRFLQSDFDRLIKTTITEKMGHVLDLYSVNKKEMFRETRIGALLGEFAIFRNDLLHDRYFQTERVYEHTHFAKIPYYANQVDVIQALTIAIQIFQSLRFCIPSIDLMPNILIHRPPTAGFLKLDLLFKKLVVPLFHLLLRKHDLTTHLTCKYSEFTVAPSPSFQPGSIKMGIRYAPTDEKTNVKANPLPTSYSPQLFARMQRLIRMSEEEFSLPHYNLQ